MSMGRRGGVGRARRVRRRAVNACGGAVTPAAASNVFWAVGTNWHLSRPAGRALPRGFVWAVAARCVDPVPSGCV